MTERILFVDDEPNVLDALRRTLRKAYEFDTATGGEEALGLIGQQQYAVVVSDMRMPGMTGDVFLAKAHVEQPDAIQMILSGQADLSSTVAAVNDGNVFRFLMKPVSKDVLTSAIDGALRQFRLVEAERELLELTLSGAVEALTEVLGLVSPAATRRTNQVSAMVERIAPAVGLQNDWQLRLASLLCAVGYAAVPPEVVERSDSGATMTAGETEMLARHGHVAAQLIGHIPRLDGVAGLIAAQAGAAPTPPGLETQVRVLDLATEVTNGLLAGRDLEAVVDALRSSGQCPADMLDALCATSTLPNLIVEEHALPELRSGMVLRADVLSEPGVVLASAGSTLSKTLLERLRNFDKSAGVRSPILVEYDEDLLVPQG